MGAHDARPHGLDIVGVVDVTVAVEGGDGGEHAPLCGGRGFLRGVGSLFRRSDPRSAPHDECQGRDGDHPCQVLHRSGLLCAEQIRGNPHLPINVYYSEPTSPHDPGNHGKSKERAWRHAGGADVYWRPWWGGLTGRRVNGGADISLHGLFGDFPSVRLSVMGGLVIPLPAGLSAALEAGGANIRGDPAPEEVWRLGGSGEWLRGYPRVVLRGSEVWRSRAELQRKISLLAVSVFHDWASVDGSSLQSAGGGRVRVQRVPARGPGASPVALVRGGISVPGSPHTGIDQTHQPRWQWHLRALAPF